jgi:hypothetical protein
MTRPMRDVDVPLLVLILQIAAARTHSPSDHLAYDLGAWLIQHPEAPVSTDDNYPLWAAQLAEQDTYYRPQETT